MRHLIAFLMVLLLSSAIQDDKYNAIMCDENVYYALSNKHIEGGEIAFCRDRLDEEMEAFYSKSMELDNLDYQSF